MGTEPLRGTTWLRRAKKREKRNREIQKSEPKRRRKGKREEWKHRRGVFEGVGKENVGPISAKDFGKLISLSILVTKNINNFF